MKYSLSVKNLPPITAEFEDDALIRLSFKKYTTKILDIPPLVENLHKQLEEYAAGKRREFDVKIKLDGTPFRTAVWRELLKIKFGQTRSYQEVAEAVGGANKARAVGMAVHNNPICVIVPCHRVIGKNGSLVGFAEGLGVKAKLLEIEGVYPKRLQ